MELKLKLDDLSMQRDIIMDGSAHPREGHSRSEINFVDPNRSLCVVDVGVTKRVVFIQRAFYPVSLR